jgi:hypothetical protein
MGGLTCWKKFYGRNLKKDCSWFNEGFKSLAIILDITNSPIVPAKCRNENCLSGGVHPQLFVGKNEAAKASDFNREQQISMSGLQQIQYQPLRDNKFQ